MKDKRGRRRGRLCENDEVGRNNKIAHATKPSAILLAFIQPSSGSAGTTKLF
jgi:hypothetical protein